MNRSDDHGRDRPRDAGPRTGPLPTPSRYDLVLALIPAALLGAVLLGDLLSVPPRDALAGGAVVAVVALVDALFLNPPRNAGLG